MVTRDEASPDEITELSEISSDSPGTAVAVSGSLSEEEALAQDAQGYASDQGVDLEEAVRRLKLEDPIGDLQADLLARERETFAGLWIQHSPDYQVIVQFTRHGEETIRPYIEGGPLVDIVEVRPAGRSLAELEATQDAVMDTILELDISVNSGLNLSENRVELYVTDPAVFDTTLKEAGIQLPDSVVVIGVDELASPG
jgi:hypothetical protein